jgi:hypothetical protein
VLDRKIQNYNDTHFEVRLARSREQNILIGIASPAVLGLSDAYKNPDVAMYVTGDGFVCVGGKEVEGGRAVLESETVLVSVEAGKGVISWAVAGKTLASAQLPQAMREKELFPALMMYNKDDQL